MSEKENLSVTQEQEKPNAPKLEVKGAEQLIQEALESMAGREQAVPKSEPAESSKDVDEQEVPEQGVSSAEVQELRRELEAERAAGQKKEKEFKELYENFVRLSADFDNFRKRTLREKDELRKYAHESPVRDLLAVFDNFERALGTLKDASDSVREGIEMVYRQFLDILKRYGVERFESKGHPFDYNRHEALSTYETNDVPPDMVFEEYQAGYMLYERLLRPAAVVVSKALPVKVEEVIDVEASSKSSESPSDEGTNEPVKQPNTSESDASDEGEPSSSV